MAMQPTLGKNQHKQAGIVSIMVTLIIMLVISLIVISFARISRREQRQALDRQLSTQAFYAAESGINAVQQDVQSGVAIADKSDCLPAPTIDSATNTSVSCLIIDTSPDTLEYKDIGTDSEVVPILSATGLPVNEVQLVWRSKDGTSTLSSCTGSISFPAVDNSVNNNCKVGVLRVDLVPTNGGLTRTNLINNMSTVFLYPHTNGGGTDTTVNSTGLVNQGRIVLTECTTDGVCTMTITGLNSPSYHMRLRTIYGSSSVTVSATNSASTRLELAGAQALVDATGKAQDVLRRIQARLPITSSINIPDFALQTGVGLCKRYNVITGASGSVSLSGGDGSISDPTNPCSIN